MQSPQSKRPRETGAKLADEFAIQARSPEADVEREVFPGTPNGA
jgi:hypothetical protein